MSPEGAASRLNDLLQKAGLDPLDDPTVAEFSAYCSLFVRWNAKLNLSSVRDEERILSRHIIESIAVARLISGHVTTLLDFGSGGGLPGIPIALCRPQIAVTLAESQGKKAAFLQEAVRVLGITAKVHADRAEALRAVFDCVDSAGRRKNAEGRRGRGQTRLAQRLARADDDRGRTQSASDGRRPAVPLGLADLPA